MTHLSTVPLLSYESSTFALVDFILFVQLASKGINFNGNLAFSSFKLCLCKANFESVAYSNNYSGDRTRILFSNISASNAQVNIPTKPIEVDLFVDGLSLLRPEALLDKSLKAGGKTQLTIDNKPSSQMTIKSVKQLPITINVTQPDGSVKEL